MNYSSEARSPIWLTAFAEARARAERVYGVGDREAETFAGYFADLVEAEAEAGQARQQPAPVPVQPAAAPATAAAAATSPDAIRAGWARAFGKVAERAALHG